MVNKRLLISSLCFSTSIFSFHHCYLCLPRLHENYLFATLEGVGEDKKWEVPILLLLDKNLNFRTSQNAWLTLLPPSPQSKQNLCPICCRPSCEYEQCCRLEKRQFLSDQRSILQTIHNITIIKI